MEPSHKELLISLMGSTYGELKRLDDSIIGSSNNISSKRDNIKQELESIIKGIPSSKPDVPILQAMRQPEPPQLVPPPHSQPGIVIPVSQPQTQPQTQTQTVYSDPNQLELELYKTVKFGDVINAIDRLYEKINKLEYKIDEISKKIDTPKKKASGLTQS